MLLLMLISMVCQCFDVSYFVTNEYSNGYVYVNDDDILL